MWTKCMGDFPPCFKDYLTISTFCHIWHITVTPCERHGVSNHLQHEFLFIIWFRPTTKKHIETRHYRLFDGNTPVTGELSYKGPVMQKLIQYVSCRVLWYWTVISYLKIYFACGRIHLGLLKFEHVLIFRYYYIYASEKNSERVFKHAT